MGCDELDGTPPTNIIDGGADAAVVTPPSTNATAPFIQYVDPFIGTGGLGFGVGSAFPGPQRPFGVARPGPDTSTNGTPAPEFLHCSGYSYLDTHIDAFSHTRMHGTGIADYGVVSLMPTIGMAEAKTHPDGYRSHFDHDTEIASPGYYAVTLDDANVRVELTATDHVGIHRWTFPAGSDAVVLFDNAHTIGNSEVTSAAIEVDEAAQEISGFAHFVGGYSGRFGGMPVYFVARFSKPFTRHGVWLDGVLAEGAASREGAHTGAYVAFDVSSDAVVEGAVAVSFVDVAHARANLIAESAVVDFDAARAAAEAAWETELARVEIAARSEDDFERFYTALYHSLMMPTLGMDADGTYRGMDGEVHTASGFRYYTDFSLWDTFRTQHPLLTLLYPERQRDMARSLVQMIHDGGYVDSWPLGIGYTGGMVGESAAIVFADSVVKGVDDFDVRAAYDSMRSTAVEPTPTGSRYGGRTAIEDYVSLGYVPTDAAGGSVSITLEYAYDDACLAVLAASLGESADHDLFVARSRNYENVYDATSQFFVGRHRDGSFETLLNPTMWMGYYTEGDAWQYVWYAPHDLEGLATLLGGRDAMLTRLDNFFEQSMRLRPNGAPDPYYWHGNEPDLHAAFLYSAMGDSSRTADVVRWILATRYNNEEDGLAGNDDAGTLSAWYVFAAMGIYPIAGTPDYYFGSPIVQHATMHLPSGDVRIDAEESSDSVRYITRATLDGVEITSARISHADLLSSGTLTFEMSDQPAN